MGSGPRSLFDDEAKLVAAACRRMLPAQRAGPMLARARPYPTTGSSISTTRSIRRARDLFGADRRADDRLHRRTCCGVDRAEAQRIQKGYFHDHGTTLAGLMAEHGVDPHAFLAYVHDIEMDVLERGRAARRRDRAAAGAQAGLHQRRRALCAARCSTGSGWATASRRSTTSTRCDLIAQARSAGLCGPVRGVSASIPTTALFVEDMARNLKPAKAIGMTTVWVDNGSEQAPTTPTAAIIDYTDHRPRPTGCNDITGGRMTDLQRRSTPPGKSAPSIGLDTSGEVRDAVDDGARRCSTRARRASPSPTAMAAGGSTSG